ncbi:MAG TPA: glutathione S-transferase family protein [Opitutus sp.]|nr:glutathione S-transferase family protein [Opitutus sp.]
MNPRPQFSAEQVDGEFERQEDAFREWITKDGSSGYAAVTGRYHLYVSLACPWATRVAIVRTLLGLEEAIGMTVVDPVRDERGWAFRDGPGFGKDPVNGFRFLSEAYRATRADFRGRYTVPVLWDKETKRIVNNSEDDICRMLSDAFGFHAPESVDLFPEELKKEQEALSEWIYERINNGVYRAGFATKQAAYERACRRVFEALDELEVRLAASRYLFGRRIVETDWRLFNTLVRFDAVYHGHFKCNVRRIVDYPNLQGYLQDLYQQTGVAALVNFDHIKRHYYVTHTEINPTQIVPLGPALDLTAPHGRERL